MSDESNDPDAGEEAEPTSLDPDRPIKKIADDQFQRAGFAKVLARHIGAVPENESLVFSLHGAWGSGKTSVLHMVEEALGDIAEVVWFNPWLFSGTEQIASQFMSELAIQLGSKDKDLSRIGELVESYGRVLEVGGSIFSGALKALGPLGAMAAGASEAGLASALGESLQAAKKESIRDTRARVEKALREAGKRLVVFVDDIDRLDKAEIRMMFKMVRLVADFPNITYVLAFDRPRVEEALGKDDTTV